MSSLRLDRRRHWKKKSRRPRREWPNFFVGFRVTSPELIAKVEELQTAIRDTFPEVASCLIDPRTLHVTLCVLRLRDDAAIDQACQVLRSEAARVASDEFTNSPPQFDFTEWGCFGHNVVHAKLDVITADGQRLTTVAERLHGEFSQLGLTTETFRRPFTPHMTVWKTSRDHELIKNLNARREVDEPSVQDEVIRVVTSFNRATTGTLTRLGSEYPRSVELLNMKTREEDGYYRQVASAFWCNG